MKTAPKSTPKPLKEHKQALKKLHSELIRDIKQLVSINMQRGQRMPNTDPAKQITFFLDLNNGGRKGMIKGILLDIDQNILIYPFFDDCYSLNLDDVMYIEDVITVYEFLISWFG